MEKLKRYEISDRLGAHAGYFNSINQWVKIRWTCLPEDVEKLEQENTHLWAQLNEIPEGCTVADAKKLREANHALASEIATLNKRIAKLEAPRKVGWFS